MKGWLAAFVGKLGSHPYWLGIGTIATLAGFLWSVSWSVWDHIPIVPSPMLTCDYLAADSDDIGRQSHGERVAQTIETPRIAISTCQSEISIAEAAGHREVIPRLEDQLGRAREAIGDMREAQHHYELSARGGYPPGMARYAIVILGSFPEVAVHYLEVASGKSVIATFKMGDFYWAGFHDGLVKECEQRSMALIKLAVDMHFAPAMDHPAYKKLAFCLARSLTIAQCAPDGPGQCPT